jgi:hypothetical protein
MFQKFLPPPIGRGCPVSEMFLDKILKRESFERLGRPAVGLIG